MERPKQGGGGKQILFPAESMLLESWEWKLGMEADWVRGKEAEVKEGPRGSVGGSTRPPVAAGSDSEESHAGFQRPGGALV